MARTGNVYKNAGSDYDCTNGGISSKYDKVVFVANGEQSDEPNAVRIIRRGFGSRIVFHAEPIAQDGTLINGMAGGNFVSFDSLVADMYPEYPELQDFYGLIALHDRSETQAEYDMLSR